MTGDPHEDATLKRLPPEDGGQRPILYCGREPGGETCARLRRLAALPGGAGAVVGFPGDGVVAAFDPEEGGVLAGEACGRDPGGGLRLYRTGVQESDLGQSLSFLADDLARTIPTTAREPGLVRLDVPRMNRLLREGARWAVRQGFGTSVDLGRLEGEGKCAGADPDALPISLRRDHWHEMGTLATGSGAIDLLVADEAHPDLTAHVGIASGEVVMAIRCGSRTLGPRVTEMAEEAGAVTLTSPEGRRLRAALAAAGNFAIANRHIVGTLAHRSFARCIRRARVELLLDLLHDSVREETSRIGDRDRRLVVHRTRAFRMRDAFFLQEVGLGAGVPLLAAGHGRLATLDSAPASTDRRLSRSEAATHWTAREVEREVSRRGILLRAAETPPVAAEAPWAFDPVDHATRALVEGGIVRTIARLRPLFSLRA